MYFLYCLRGSQFQLECLSSCGILMSNKYNYIQADDFLFFFDLQYFGLKSVDVTPASLLQKVAPCF